MTQARGSHREPDDEFPPLPTERPLPTVTDEVPELDEAESPELPADEIVEVEPVQEVVDDPSSGAR